MKKILIITLCIFTFICCKHSINPTLSPQKIEYTITFKKNNAAVAGTMDTITVEEGKTITLPDNCFYMDGFQFIGWNTESDGSGFNYADKESIQLTSSIVLFAQWLDIRIPTYNIIVTAPENGTVLLSQDSAESGTEVTITLIPDSFYDVDTVLVTGEYNTVINTTQATDTNRKYTFIMPNQQINVRATFKAITVTPENIEEKIKTMINSGTAKVTGTFDLSKTDSNTIRKINAALKELYNNKPEIRVSLDLSEVSNLTELEDTFPNSDSPVYDYNSKKYSFNSCDNLREIILPQNLEKIGGGAFYNCKNLESIIIPNTVNTLGSWAFADCSNLKNVQLSTSIKELGDRTFLHCTALEEIEIPGNIETLGDFCFGGCTTLKNVIITEGCKSIGSCFYDCSSLESITLPSSLNSFSDGSYGFKNCTNLTNVYYTGTISQWCNIICANWAATPLCNASNLFIDGKEITGELCIPSSVTTIRPYAFYNCSKITSVVIENGVMFIYHDAFNHCINLESISIPESVCYIEAGSFRWCGNLNYATFEKTQQWFGQDQLDTNPVELDPLNDPTNNAYFLRCFGANYQMGIFNENYTSN